MARLEIELSDTLHDWAKQMAAQNELTFDAYIEVLLALESGLARTSPDGRLLRTRSFIYRDHDAYLVPEAAHDLVARG